MRILFLGNGRVAYQLLRWLRNQDDDIVGLVIHPPPTRKCGEEIIDAAGLDDSQIFDGSRLREPQVLEAVGGLKPDIGISVFFGYILKPDFLQLFSTGCINLHPGFLPYNRGGYPNVWSIIEGKPAGATIHWIDEGVDTGCIIARKEVPIEPVDTGETLYHKLQRACIDVFMAFWPLVRRGEAPRIQQEQTVGTYHRDSDVEEIDHIDLDTDYRAVDLINILRARTFPPYPGAYFVHQGRRVYMRLELMYEDECESG